METTKVVSTRDTGTVKYIRNSGQRKAGRGHVSLVPARLLSLPAAVVGWVGACRQEGDAPVGFVGRDVLILEAVGAGGSLLFVQLAGVFACQAGKSLTGSRALVRRVRSSRRAGCPSVETAPGGRAPRDPALSRPSG